MSVALDYTGSCSSWSGTPSIDEARRLPCTHALSSSLPSAITKRGLRTRNASHLEDSPLALHFHGTGKVTNSAAANIDERQDAAALQIQRAWRAWVKETAGSASPSQASCQTVSDVQSSLCAPADAERASSGASCSTSSSSSSGATAASLFHQYSRPHRFHASKPRVWPRYHKSLSVHVPPPDSELPPHEVDAILGGGFWAPSADRVPRHGSKRVTAPAAGASAASSTISLFMQQRMRRMQREAEEALEMLRWKEVVRIACTVKHRAGGAGAKLRRAMQEVWVTAVGLCCGYNVHVEETGCERQPLLGPASSGIGTGSTGACFSTASDAYEGGHMGQCEEGVQWVEQDVSVEAAEAHLRHRLALAAPGIDPEDLLTGPRPAAIHCSIARSACQGMYAPPCRVDSVSELRV